MSKIEIENLDGTLEEAEVINAFGIEELNKEFVILTKKEPAGEGLEKIYVSEVAETETGTYKMLGIETPEIWEKVKEAMKEIVTSN